MFASEIILGEFGVRAFGSLVISSVTATVISRTMLGDVPAFEIPEYALIHPAEISRIEPTAVYCGGVDSLVDEMELERGEGEASP